MPTSPAEVQTISKLTPLYRQQKHAARIIFFKDNLKHTNLRLKQVKR